MAINDILGLTVDVTAKTDGFVKALEKAAAAAKINLDIAGPMVDKFKDAQKDIKTIFAKTVADAATAGMGRANIDKFVGKLQPITDNIESSMKRIFRMEMASKKQGLSDEKQARIKTLLEEEKRKLQGLQTRLKIENREASKIIKRRQAAVEEAERLASRSFSEAAEEAGESLQKSFESIKSGNVGDLAKGAGKRAGAWGAALQEKGQAKGGMMGGLMSGIGGLLSKIGPALMAIGAIAAGFAAIVAVVLQADAAVKDLNRTLLASGGAGLDLAGQFREVGSTLTKVSTGFMDAFAFNRIWGTTAKDHLEILGSYAEAGITFRKMTEGVKDAGEEMERLKKYTASALTYSKLLGLSTKEVSEAMGEYMMDLGFTLDGINGKFANISRAAMDSGFSTKRFFNMVLQATSGMSMYNVRLEEAASLLKSLSKILGQKMGGDMLQELTKGFKDESTQERIKKTMTTGVGYSLEVLKKDAIKSSEEFNRKMQDLGKTAAGSESKKAIEEALDSALGPGASQKSPEELVKAMSKLSTAEQSKILARAESSKDPAMVRMLAEIMNKSQAFGGKGLASAQAARQFAGAGAVLDLQLNEVRAVLGKSLEDIDLSDMTQRMAWEAITGKSGEAALKLFETGKRFTGRHEVLAEEQAKIRGARPEDQAKLAQDFNAKYGKEFGVVLDDAGNRFRAVLNKFGAVDYSASFKGTRLEDTRRDMLLTAGDELLGKEEEKVAEDIQLAQEIAANTTDMAKILEQGVEWLLSQIYKSVEYIASLLGKETYTEEEKKARGQAVGDLSEKEQATRREMRSQEAAIAALVREAKSPRTKEDRRKEIQTEIEERQTAIKKLGARAEVFSATAQQVGRMSAEEAHKYGPNLGVTGLTGAAAAQEPVKAEIRKQMAVIDPERAAQMEQQADMAYKEERGRIKAHFTDWRNDLGLGLGSYRESRAQKMGEEYGSRQKERVEAAYAEQFLGITPGVRQVEHDLFTGGGGPGAITGGTVATDKSIVGEKLFIGQNKENKKDAIALSKRELTAEEKQKEALAKKIVEGIAKNEEERADQALAADMARLGMGENPQQLLQMAHALRTTGTIPRVDMTERVADPVTGQMRRRADILQGSANIGQGAFALQQRYKYEPPPAAPAKDFLMHIGSDGQVKFAQRIDGADTVALASKGGGAVSTAAGKAGGGGGVTIVQHNYSNMEAVQKGWRTLMAARAIR